MIAHFKSALIITLFLGLLPFPADTNAQSAPQTSDLQLSADQALRVDSKAKIRWFPAELLTIEGKGFEDTATTWTRLPARYQSRVTEGVWTHGKSSTGITVRFHTDASQIHVRWDAPQSSMNHMARSGSNGLDLYSKTDGKWRYAGTGIPKSVGVSEARIFPEKFAATSSQTSTSSKEFLLFLPTYSTTRLLEIGVPEGARLARAMTETDRKPIVFYGTSITQAGCASKSGSGHVERLRRSLDWPTINLGFSGSGKCEPVMAELLAEISASLYIIETVPNMTDELIQERSVPFIKTLREKQPHTPILLVASPNVPLNLEKNLLWKKAFDAATADGVENLHFLDGDKLYGDVDSPTVDGVHPTDLGFNEMAVQYEPVIRKILDLN